MKVWKPETSVESRNSVGGTSKSSVLTQVKLVKKWLSISTSTANQLGATSQFAGSAVSPSRTNFVSPQLLDHFLGRDLISLRDYTPEEILQILEASSWLKSKLRSQSYRDHPIKFMEMIQNYQPLIGRTVSMIFQKRSTRTRVSIPKHFLPFFFFEGGLFIASQVYALIIIRWVIMYSI